MEILQHNLPGLLILLILGLRHGLDPDHITIIDNYTYRLHQKQSIWTRWVGTLFAFGHGVMVTIIALALSLVKNSFAVPEMLNFFIDWFPQLMLLSIGMFNLVSLLKQKEVKLMSFRKFLVPQYFNDHLNPFSIVLTGLIFGFIFDTSSQIAAFGFAISVADQWMYSVIGGLIFSVGLMLTGTFDSFYLSRLMSSFDSRKIQDHRFRLNVLITAMCFIIPAYNIMLVFDESFELTDTQYTIAGICFIAMVLSLYFEMYVRSLKRKGIS